MALFSPTNPDDAITASYLRARDAAEAVLMKATDPQHWYDYTGVGSIDLPPQFAAAKPYVDVYNQIVAFWESGVETQDDQARQAAVGAMQRLATDARAKLLNKDGSAKAGSTVEKAATKAARAAGHALTSGLKLGVALGVAGAVGLGLISLGARAAARERSQ